MFQRKKRVDALRGTLDLLVLRTLSRGPQHGYGIAADIQRQSEDVLRVEEGSLYPALHQMEQAGWIDAEWHITPNNRRARLYRITAGGRERLETEQDEWQRLTRAVGKVLRYV
jgi:PadR family transcriptional regulator PadR